MKLVTVFLHPSLLYEVWDMDSDIIAWQEGYYPEELRPFFATSSILGIIVIIFAICVRLYAAFYLD